jgi:RHH-type transcriptional regulator, proline utilization regulon repressor / proline dehydrogenase / delta 1-pyrroline-5-carboxylate dehydrogenase
VAGSDRFRRQLIDAVSSYKVGYPWEPASQVGPLIGPARGKLLRALTRLEPGQSWVLAPQQLDTNGMLWKPGIREGVEPGSEYHLTEYFGPVLGIMTAATLDEAIAIVNTIEYGLTSGLHSLDQDEITRWADTVEAGNLYVNRHITGAIVQRQSFGGWKKSAVGAGAKAGGPNYLIGLGSWQDDPVSDPGAVNDAVTGAALAAARDAGVPESELAWLQGALASDQTAYATEFDQAHDPTGLACEQNLLRYRHMPVTVRVERASEAALIRVIAAGARTGSRVVFSAAEALPAAVAGYLAALELPLFVENRVQWGARAAALAAAGGRVRLLGGSVAELSAVVAGSPSLAIYGGEVVSAGRIEMLPYLREQAVSITAHRFGTPHRYALEP